MLLPLLCRLGQLSLFLSGNFLRAQLTMWSEDLARYSSEKQDGIQTGGCNTDKLFPGILQFKTPTNIHSTPGCSVFSIQYSNFIWILSSFSEAEVPLSPSVWVHVVLE